MARQGACPAGRWLQATRDLGTKIWTFKRRIRQDLRHDRNPFSRIECRLIGFCPNSPCVQRIIAVSVRVDGPTVSRVVAVREGDDEGES